MKRILSIVLISIMILGLLTGCNGDISDTNGSNGDADPNIEFTKLSMATGGTSGTYYGFSAVIAQVIQEKLGDIMEITVESTGASKVNIHLLDSGDAQLAIVQNDVMAYAYDAKDMFAGESPITCFSAVASCYPEQCQIIASSSITSIEDLRGKKVSVGDAGSGVEFNARQILEAYGIAFDDIIVNNQSFADSADSLRNGTIDAAFVTAGAPTTAVTELASDYSFNILEIDNEHVKILQNSYGFYTPVIIPGGTYNGVSADIQTVAVMATIVARNDVPKEIIYEFTKGLFEYKADIIAGHAKGELLDPATGVSGISIPFHPGAVKYYTEIGIK